MKLDRESLFLNEISLFPCLDDAFRNFALIVGITSNFALLIIISE